MSSKTRLVRQTPLADRIKAYLNPLDFLLWASEELNGGDWEDAVERWSAAWGLGLNLVFVVARGSAGPSAGGDDVFVDSWGGGWMGWIASVVAHSLAILSVLNAAYTFNRKRRYRLFESSLAMNPTSHSLHRVRVDSSPAAASPLRFLTEMLPLGSTSTEDETAPGDPNPTRDQVWELALWDPTKLSLRLFTLFSPGHILIYWLYLPLAPLDSRPSVTVATALFLAALLSLQLSLLTRNFTQQSKDSSLIHKEVQHEYDTKFVHPSLYKPVRDVGTQTTTNSHTPSNIREVLTYTPTTYVNRGFHIQPSPRYAAYLPQDMPDASDEERVRVARSTSTPLPVLSTAGLSSPLKATPGFSSPLKPSTVQNKQPIFRPGESRPSTAFSRPSTAVSTGTQGDGGSFGVYTHAYSPLKRSGFAPGPGSSPLKDRRAASPSKEDSPFRLQQRFGDLRDPRR